MLKYTDSPQVQGICARAHLQYGDSFYTTNVGKYKKTRKQRKHLKSQHDHVCTLPSLSCNWWHHSTHKRKSVLVKSSAFASVDKALFFLCEFVTVFKLPSRALLRD